jgi:Domain of unknown function (DUF4179)/Family of unknown function (DUF5643)
MNEDIKDLIKISEGLDEAIIRGIEKGKTKKKHQNKNNIIKKVSIAAAITLATVASIGLIEPQFVSAIPVVNKVFDYFNKSNIGYSTEKYSELSEVINKSIEKNGMKITLSEIAIDDNKFIASFIVESEALRGFESDKSENDFFVLNHRLNINGERSRGGYYEIRKIDDNKGVIVLIEDISNINLPENLKVDLEIREVERAGKVIAKGPWIYNINTVKEINSEVYKGNKSIKVEGGEVWVDKLVKTPLTNNLVIKGKDLNGTNEGLGLRNLKYIIKDDKGNILLSKFDGGHYDKEGNYEARIRILDDLSNTNYIEVLTTKEDFRVIREIDSRNVPLLICTSNSEYNINREEEIVSRDPSKDELDKGYALSKVSYYINIDKNKAFQPIENLIGNEIKVNSEDKVIITNIDANDKFTTINMNIDGLYDYNNLSSLVIFDEDMNDISKGEGHKGVVLENPETKEFSITLKPIDKNKKYTIAIPMAKEVELDDNNKILINLN